MVGEVGFEIFLDVGVRWKIILVCCKWLGNCFRSIVEVERRVVVPVERYNCVLSAKMRFGSL